MTMVTTMNRSVEAESWRERIASVKLEQLLEVCE